VKASTNTGSVVCCVTIGVFIADATSPTVVIGDVMFCVAVGNVNASLNSSAGSSCDGDETIERRMNSFVADDVDAPNVDDDDCKNPSVVLSPSACISDVETADEWLRLCY